MKVSDKVKVPLAFDGIFYVKQGKLKASGCGKSKVQEKQIKININQPTRVEDLKTLTNKENRKENQIQSMTSLNTQESSFQKLDLNKNLNKLEQIQKQKSQGEQDQNLTQPQEYEIDASKNSKNQKLIKNERSQTQELSKAVESQKQETQQQNIKQGTKEVESIQQVNQLKVFNKDDIKKFYKIGKIIGAGSTAEVREATHLVTQEKRAVKILSKSSIINETEFVTEVKKLNSIDHPNVPRVYELFTDQKKFYLVQEYCSGGELIDKLIEKSNFDENQAALIMRQILSAITFCHEKQIVHGDLKPENILFATQEEDSIIKVIDFGTSIHLNTSLNIKKIFKNPFYVAPEVLNKSFNEKCDVWSCGVILYLLLCGAPPFNGANDAEIIKNIQQGIFQMDGDVWKQITQEAKDLINGMLKVNSNERYSAKQVLEDKWIQNNVSYPQKQIDSRISENVLSNMAKFKAGNKLQNAVTLFIVESLTTKKEREDLEKMFMEMDVNGDGKLSREEVWNGYSQLAGNYDEDIINQIFKKADIDNSGFINYNEFVAVTVDLKSQFSKQKLEDCFNLFDKDGSGTITLEELRIALNYMQGGDDQTLQNLLKQADTSGDGEIDIKEFKDLMLKLL